MDSVPFGGGVEPTAMSTDFGLRVFHIIFPGFPPIRLTFIPVEMSFQ